MNGNRKGFYLFLVGIVMMMAFFVAASPAPVQADNPNSRIFPPGAHMYGMSHGDWSQYWWEVIGDIPSGPTHPIIQAGAVDCSVGAINNVYLLSGSFGTVTERSCTVPAHTALFVPIANALVWSDNDFPEGDEQAARDVLDFYMSFLEATTLEIDGDPIALDDYRFKSDLYQDTVHPENVFGIGTEAWPPVGDFTRDFMSDGYWVMVKPLAPGEHTIQFTASPWGLDVTYHITVTD